MSVKRWTILSLLCLPALSWGQTPYYPAPGYGGGYYPGRVGGALYGSADVMRAGGENWIQAQEAWMVREKTMQAKIDTKRKAFDEARYEAANTPSTLEKAIADELKLFQRIVLRPGDYEIYSGKAFNVMLPYLDRMAREGTYGPPPPLPPSLIERINITQPGKTALLLLSDVKAMPWPFALLGPTQEKLEQTLEKNLESVRKKGRVDPKLYNECQAQYKKLRAELEKNVDEERISAGKFMDGSSFLDKLNKEIIALADPLVARTLAAPQHPQARDTLELVGFMISNGLEFAPCKTGDESAYKALHYAMATFAQSAQLAASLTTDPTLRVTPPQQPKKPGKK